MYNQNVTTKLRDNAKKALNKINKIVIKDIEVPGAFEIPVMISRIAKKYDGFIAIGCIIKGQTKNFDLISEAITNGIMQISIQEKKPIGNAILTCFNQAQAKNRFDKGTEAADAVISVLKNESKKNKNSSPRIKIIQKIYGSLLNPDEEIIYSKNQYRKYIKDVVSGTLERTELIEEIVIKSLQKDINLKKTDKILKIILFAAVFEFMYKHNIPKKVVISEYVRASEFFLEKAQISYLNAILDKLSKLIRKE